MILGNNYGYIKHEHFHNILRATAEHSTHGEQGWCAEMGHGYKASLCGRSHLCFHSNERAEKVVLRRSEGWNEPPNANMTTVDYV